MTKAEINLSKTNNNTFFQPKHLHAGYKKKEKQLSYFQQRQANNDNAANANSYIYTNNKNQTETRVKTFYMWFDYVITILSLFFDRNK